LVKEWKSVKLTAGAAVMRSLQEVFGGPVQQILDLWGQKEQAGGCDWYMSEAGRYAFKILGKFASWHWAKAKNLQPQDALQSVSSKVGDWLMIDPISRST
jgi:hypothetical protein